MTQPRNVKAFANDDCNSGETSSDELLDGSHGSGAKAELCIMVGRADRYDPTYSSI